MSQIYFIAVTLYMFQCFHPSSGVQDCTYSNRHMSNRHCFVDANQVKETYQYRNIKGKPKPQYGITKSAEKND